MPSKDVGEGSMCMGLWKHTPETCPGRSKEGAKMLSDFWPEVLNGKRKEFEFSVRGSQ